MLRWNLPAAADQQESVWETLDRQLLTNWNEFPCAQKPTVFNTTTDNNYLLGIIYLLVYLLRLATRLTVDFNYSYSDYSSRIAIMTARVSYLTPYMKWKFMTIYNEMFHDFEELTI